MNQTTPIPFGEALKAQRRRLQISQEVAARVVGVSVSCWCNWERGNDPRLFTRTGAMAVLESLQPGDPRLLPNHLRDRTMEVAP